MVGMAAKVALWRLKALRFTAIVTAIENLNVLKFVSTKTMTTLVAKKVESGGDVGYDQIRCTERIGAMIR